MPKNNHKLVYFYYQYLDRFWGLIGIFLERSWPRLYYFLKRHKEKIYTVSKIKIKHIYGPKKIAYSSDEVVIVCLIKDAELYLKSLIKHHFALGVKHIFFLDNGSKDGTIEIIKKYSNVSIYQTLSPFNKYGDIMRRILIRKLCQNHWCLNIDQDELFDYPYSNIISLKSLLTYLKNNFYTALVAYNLDMFSDRSLFELNSNLDDSLKEKYNWYDLSGLQKYDYFLDPKYCSKNKLSNKNIKLYTGGIRRKIFKTKPWLIKHPIIFIDKKIVPVTTPHYVDNANIADFTGVLYHYKFLSNCSQKAQEIVREKSMPDPCMWEWKNYRDILVKTPDLRLTQETKLKLKDVNELMEKDFLIVSQNYLDWVEKIKNNNK